MAVERRSAARRGGWGRLAGEAWLGGGGRKGGGGRVCGVTEEGDARGGEGVHITGSCGFERVGKPALVSLLSKDDTSLGVMITRGYRD